MTVVLHHVLRTVHHLKTHHPQRYRRLIRMGGVLGLVVLVMRLGLSGLNNLLWLLGVMLPFLRQPPFYGDSNASSPPSARAMPREEAAQILGVAADADERAIRNAYRDLMQRNHPDHGGSEYLASQINQAKDVLLKK